MFICVISKIIVMNRLLEVISCKIFKVEKDEALLDCLSVAGTKVYRIDEIPRSEFNMASDEFIVPVAHFHKVSTIWLHWLCLMNLC